MISMWGGGLGKNLGKKPNWTFKAINMNITNGLQDSKSLFPTEKNQTLWGFYLHKWI